MWKNVNGDVTKDRPVEAKLRAQMKIFVPSTPTQLLHCRPPPPPPHPSTTLVAKRRGNRANKKIVLGFQINLYFSNFSSLANKLQPGVIKKINKMKMPFMKVR